MATNAIRQHVFNYVGGMAVELMELRELVEQKDAQIAELQKQVQELTPKEKANETAT